MIVLVALVLTLPGSALAAAARVPAWAVPWQALLQRYVVVVSAARAPLATRVDYERLAAAPDRDAQLGRVRSALLGVDPATMDDKARLAWAIDTYNFVVIERVVQHLHDGQGGARIGSVRDVAGFFDHNAVTVGGKPYSLDAFESAFVFPDRGLSPPARNHWRLEPRAHFALVCGAVGCPALRREAYIPDDLEDQLERATKEALASPAHLRFDPATGAVEQSQIFAWYPKDFGMRGWEFLVRYVPPAVKAGIARHAITHATGVISWDWSLNQAPSGTR